MAKLKDLVEIRSGYTFRSSIESFDAGPVEVIQSKDLGMDFNFSARPMINFPGEDKHFLQPGDILVSARGFTKAIIFNNRNSRAVASSSLFVLKPKNNQVSSEFIEMFFNSDYGMRAAFELSSGAALKSITKSNLGQIDIPEIPPGKSHSLGLVVYAIDEYLRLLTEKEIELKNVREAIISKTLKKESL